MLDINTASEQSLRRFLNEHGERDIVWNKTIHPMSAELRAAGFHKHADILDDYFAKAMGTMGIPRVLTLAEVKVRARALKERMDAK